MRVKIYGCLLVLVLGSNVSAGRVHEVVTEKQQVSLRCSQSVEDKVTWSREINGNRVDILTVDGDRDIRHDDPGRRYHTLADKSLTIMRTVLSDSGKYFCNNEPVDLTVIPSGAEALSAAAGSTVSLRCPPGAAGPTWTREAAGQITTVYSPDEQQTETRAQTRRQVSPEDQTLTVTDLRPDDEGLYYCGGRAAQYLKVTEPSETGTGFPPEPVHGESNHQHVALVLGVLLPFIVITFIVLFFTWRWRIKRRGRVERWNAVYAQRDDGSTFDFLQGGLNQNNQIYSVIQDPAPAGLRRT